MSQLMQPQATRYNLPPTVPEPFLDFLDIPMDIIIELGSTRMKIRELLALDSGSIVTLPQTVGSDLTVYVNNVCIGRGLVVAMEDRTCIRVTELVTEQ